MKITWHGQACFQIQGQNQKREKISILIDPFSEEIGLKVPKFQADILLISHSHYDHNNIKAVAGTPFLITTPGEYEIKGIFIQGIPSFHDNLKGRKRGKNIIYTIEMEKMRVCHLGDLGQKELTSLQLEKIEQVDILMVPVGGIYTINSDGAQKIISQIEPRVVIPMHYSIPKLKIKLEPVNKFLKVFGQKGVKPQPRLSIKRKDLPEEMKVVVLKP